MYFWPITMSILYLKYAIKSLMIDTDGRHGWQTWMDYGDDSTGDRSGGSTYGALKRMIVRTLTGMIAGMRVGMKGGRDDSVYGNQKVECCHSVMHNVQYTKQVFSLWSSYFQ